MISLPNVRDKVQDGMAIEINREISCNKVSDNQGRLMEECSFMTQMFTMRMVVEKMLKQKKRLFTAFIDRKKYDTDNRKGLWYILNLCDIGGRVIEAVDGFMKRVGHI